MKIVMGLVFVVLAGVNSSALAISSRVAGELQRLDPEEELEQRCDVEALTRIDQSSKKYNPDKVIAYTFSPPVVIGNTMTANGAVFRSHGRWYRLSYHCVADSTELKVTSFSFTIGEQIPRSHWDRNYLYP